MGNGEGMNVFQLTVFVTEQSATHRYVSAMCWFAQAHKLERILCDAATKDLPWMKRFERVLKASYRRWATSPKKQANIAVIADLLDDKVCELCRKCSPAASSAVERRLCLKVDDENGTS